MSKTSFATIARAAFADGLSGFGFHHLGSQYFVRARDGWAEVVFPDLLRHTRKAFTVSYGLDFPLVSRALESLPGVESPGLFVSRALKNQKFYSFEKASIDEQCNLAVRDFSSEALPWFASIQSPSEAVQLFYVERIVPRQNSNVPDPRGWAIYGLLLSAIHQFEASQHWLDMAIEELERPWYSKAGQLLRERVSGARLVRQDEFDAGLIRIVKNRDRIV